MKVLGFGTMRCAETWNGRSGLAYVMASRQVGSSILAVQDALTDGNRLTLVFLAVHAEPSQCFLGAPNTSTVESERTFQLTAMLFVRNSNGNWPQ